MKHGKFMTILCLLWLNGWLHGFCMFSWSLVRPVATPTVPVQISAPLSRQSSVSAPIWSGSHHQTARSTSQCRWCRDKMFQEFNSAQTSASLKVPPYRWSKTWFPVDFPSVKQWSNGQTLGPLEELVQHFKYFNSIHRLSRHRAPYISSVHIAWPAGDPLEHFLICCSKKPSGIWPL